MIRRDFITAIGRACALSIIGPHVASAQQSERVRRIGVLHLDPKSSNSVRGNNNAFYQELARLGWNEGSNLEVERRLPPPNDLEAMRMAAHELVAAGPEVIFATGTPFAAALQRETRTIPIVFSMSIDPVGAGLVAGLPRPGGNITGFQVVEGIIYGKLVQLLKEIAPATRRVTALYNPESSPQAQYYLDPYEAAARALVMEAAFAPVHDDTEVEDVMRSAGREQGGLVILESGFTAVRDALLAAATLRNKVPAITLNPSFPRAGGLLSYGPNVDENFRQAAGYVDRILRGAKPSELPVQAPTRYEFALNLKTAKALGIEVPTATLLRATEIIE